MFDRKLLVQIGLGLILIAFLGLTYSAYRQSQDDKIRMEQVLADQKRVIQQSQDVMAATAKTLEGKLAEIEKMRSQIKTPEQAARAIPQVIPGVQPIILPQVPQPGQPVINLPKFELPADQMKILYDFAQTCHACEAKLEAANSDRTELVRQMQAVEAERNAAIKAAKGGGFWQRVKRNGKWFLVGGVVGAGIGAAASR